MAAKKTVKIESVDDKLKRIVRALHLCSSESLWSITGKRFTKVTKFSTEVPAVKVWYVSYILLDCRALRLTFKVGFTNQNEGFIQEFTNWTCGLFGRTVYPDIAVWQGLPYTRPAIEDPAFNHKQGELSVMRHYWSMELADGSEIVCSSEAFVVDEAGISKVSEKDYKLPKINEVEFL